MPDQRTYPRASRKGRISSPRCRWKARQSFPFHHSPSAEALARERASPDCSPSTPCLDSGIALPIVQSTASQTNDPRGLQSNRRQRTSAVPLNATVLPYYPFHRKRMYGSFSSEHSHRGYHAEFRFTTVTERNNFRPSLRE